MTGRVGGSATYPVATDRRFQPLPPARAEPFVIGVVDTGVVVVDGGPHPYLRGHLTDDWPDNVDALPTDGGPLDPLDGHGTFVSGLILHQAREARIRMINPLDRAAGGGEDDAVIAALHRLRADADPDLKLLNLSFSGYRPSPPDRLAEALDGLFTDYPELLVVTAAGNDGGSDPVWPAAYGTEFDRLISIGAIDDSVLPSVSAAPRASFSNYGPWVTGYASGVNVLGPRCWYTEERPADDGQPPQEFRGWCLWGGTSFAAARVTGLLGSAMLGGVAAYPAMDAVLTHLPRPTARSVVTR